MEGDNAIAMNNLANVYLAACQHAKAIDLYRKALSVQPDYVEAHSNLLLSLHYDKGYTAQEIFEEHLSWEQMHLKGVEARKHVAGGDAYNEILRLGYISADFREHSVSRFISPVITGHDHEKYELFVYSDVKNPDYISRQLEDAVSSNWKDVSKLDDYQLGELIRNDGIDILVELGGHTAHNRLVTMATKPAPIQVSYLGYPDTTGLTSIDYRLTDGLADPEDFGEPYTTEELWRLPNTFLCYQPAETHIELEPPPSLKNGYITFGSFNMSSKLNRGVVALWSRILQSVVGSRLLLKAAVLEDALTVDYLKGLFAEHGIESERIIFKGHQSDTLSHLKWYGAVDIGLDPFPYNGTTTTLEALWMGTPVISLTGQTHASRVGYSILKQLGLENCIANTEEEYCEAAIALASNPMSLQDLASGIRSRMEHSSLLDRATFVADLEEAYEQMWQRFCRNNKSIQPAVIKVEKDLSIVVPDSFSLMTPYILREQETWFEQELPFVRKVVEEGEQCLDIGANYGLYGLTMAKKCSPSGKVFAFEPTQSTAACLAMSIRENNLDTLQLIEAALSDHDGVGVMAVGDNTELSSLVSTETAGEGQQRVNLTTLDKSIDKYNFHDIAFVKLDAEGEEANIINGGKDFFSRFSPLVMYELTHGEGFNLELVNRWSGIGYESYYLVHGLQILAPFDQYKQPDKFQLNLFACKRDRANILKNRGLLSFSLQQQIDFKSDPDRRRLYFDALPFGRAFRPLWDSDSTGDQDADSRYFIALECYIESMDIQKTVEERFILLKMSYALLTDVCQQKAELPHLLTFVRVASDIGERYQAVTVLDQLYEMFQSDAPLALNKEHLAVSTRYDQIDPGDRVGEWCLSSIIEEKERLRTFSSYFADVSSLTMLEMLKDLGFQSIEMERRRQLVMIRKGELNGPEGGEMFLREGDDNLNGEWWMGKASV